MASDETDPEKILKENDVTIKYEDKKQKVFLNGKDVTSKLRDEKVGNMASKVSALPLVRSKLLGLQRELGEKYDVVMDGRDIGTHVFPNADMKIYLTADPSMRAMRRYKELIARGEVCDREIIEKDIIERDKRDMTRDIAPLRQAEDAILVDSTNLTIDEVVEVILNAFKEVR